MLWHVMMASDANKNTKKKKKCCFQFTVVELITLNLSSLTFNKYIQRVKKYELCQNKAASYKKYTQTE